MKNYYLPKQNECYWPLVTICVQGNMNNIKKIYNKYMILPNEIYIQSNIYTIFYKT